MTRAELDEVLELLGWMGAEVDVREDYSGRGMYGRECLAIVCDARGFALFCLAVGRRDEDRDLDWIGDVRSDSMGLSTVWYWPNVQVAEGRTSDV